MRRITAFACLDGPPAGAVVAAMLVPRKVDAERGPSFLAARRPAMPREPSIDVHRIRAYWTPISEAMKLPTTTSVSVVSMSGAGIE